MSNSPAPQSLDALLARAEDFALFSLRSGGMVFIRVDPGHPWANCLGAPENAG
ncbi:MAG: hypothetical protein Q7S40_22405 [Opitutaceae bacterium]|nr:hypothetical protein [Opitutaceae bacterium]